mmetsp:Transcript_4433/g.6694  ORF Transcript_4433/g.6694 Transcript_4433/m.6694 type:complete len:102 (+) Transcript_4433:118-423(+)
MLNTRALLLRLCETRQKNQNSCTCCYHVSTILSSTSSGMNNPGNCCVIVFGFAVLSLMAFFTILAIPHSVTSSATASDSATYSSIDKFKFFLPRYFHCTMR